MDFARALRRTCDGVLLAIVFMPLLLCAQKPAAVALDWGADDSARVAFLAEHGYRLQRTHIVLWAPRDSIDEQWMRALADTLDRGVAGMLRLMQAPFAWQRLGSRPVTYFMSAGRFVSHGTGTGAVFIPVSRVRERLAPFLHEAAHELLAPTPPFYYREFADTIVGARVADHTPLWLFEGLPDYLANTVAPTIGLHEGDVFAVGGLAHADSSCAARVTASARGAEVLAAIGRSVRPEMLFTTQRQEIAPIFYACGQALTWHLVRRLGVRETVALMPAMARGDWAAQVERVGGIPIETFRQQWLVQVGLASADSGAVRTPPK